MLERRVGSRGKCKICPRRRASARPTYESSPGPGTYALNEIGKHNAYVLSGTGKGFGGCKIGKEVRINYFADRTHSPGPGKYLPSDRLTSAKMIAPSCMYNWH